MEHCREFRHKCFFRNQFLPGPLITPLAKYQCFFRKFAEIVTISYLSLVSMPQRWTVNRCCWNRCLNYPGIFHTRYGPGSRFTCDSVLLDVVAGVHAVVCIISVGGLSAVAGVLRLYRSSPGFECCCCQPCCCWLPGCYFFPTVNGSLLLLVLISVSYCCWRFWCCWLSCCYWKTPIIQRSLMFPVSPLVHVKLPLTRLFLLAFLLFMKFLLLL